jgi:NADH dehydrogenase
MANSRVTVFGGSGFLGRRIVERLARDGSAVRVAVRHPERTSFLTGLSALQPITAVRADVSDEATLAPAVAGSDAVVNAVGHYVERGRATFEAIHGQGAMHVARAAATAGVRRLVHISGIGADPGSESHYVRARALGERLVQEVFPAATILRPSVMFGPEDAFLTQLAALARAMPVLPLFGTGAVRLQPVYVNDVADAVAQALATDTAEGKLYELGGPRAYTYRALLQLVLEHVGRRRLLMPVPYFVWRLLAALMSPLPNPPISRDQIILMERDNVVGAGSSSFADLGLEPHALEQILPLCLPQHSGR